MSKFFYDGRFEIKKINYSNIERDFNIYEVYFEHKQLDEQQEYDKFFKNIRELKNIKSFYLKNRLYLLGNKDFILDTLKDIEEKSVKELKLKELEELDPIIILTLLTRYIPYEIFDSNNKVRYIDMNSIYFFLEKRDMIFKFLSCTFEKYKFGEEYILGLTQKTFAHESLFVKKPFSKRVRKIGYDSATRLLIPDTAGNYYERNPFNKTIETKFIIRATDDITKLRSYYFTLIKDIIKEVLKPYINLKFNTMKSYEHFEIKSNKSFFSNSIKSIQRDIEVYKIKDIKDGQDIIASSEKEFIKNIKDFNLKNFNFSLKGIVDIDSSFDSIKNWKIFLLNSNTGENLDYDGYREIKKRCSNIISNGFLLDKDSNFNVTLNRIIEELFIKEQLKEKSISKLHSNPSLFEGVIYIHYKNEKIRKITVLKDGKIDIEFCGVFETTRLNKEFEELLKEFNLEKTFYKFINSSSDFKFMKIGKKKIYIAETGMRLYFDSNEYLNEYLKEKEIGNKGVSRSLKGFLGMSMDIRVNKKEQLYYSFYNTGIKDRETFAPNIKKIISTSRLNEKDYEIFCESLVFKYLSNPARLASYPFIFKLTNEI